MRFLDFPQFESSSESFKWEQGGWVFIKGTKNKEGKNYLFVAPVKYVEILARQKSGGAPGVPASMAILYPEFYGIGLDKFRNPVPIKVPESEEYLKKWMGLSNARVVLNHNKTPYWKSTISNKNLNQILRDRTSWFISDETLAIPTVQEKK